MFRVSPRQDARPMQFDRPSLSLLRLQRTPAGRHILHLRVSTQEFSPGSPYYEFASWLSEAAHRVDGDDDVAWGEAVVALARAEGVL